MTRGGFLHNRILLAPVAELLSDFGARVRFEYPVRRDGCTIGYIDLFAIVEDRRIAVEVECSTQRLGNDIRKVQVVGVDLLLIVMPNRKLARKAGNILKTQGDQKDQFEFFETWILPLGLAITRLTTWCQLMTFSLATRSLSHQPQKNRRSGK